AYRLFKELYQIHVGALARCDDILDFGCGWGRILRFFLKDLEPTRLWGADPVEEMIDFCRTSNPWCAFYCIDRTPPTPFRSDTFDCIYSFSVFSHLSEPMHRSWLGELHRILKPGGILIATTRDREFIRWCADLRTRVNLDAMHPGPRSSATAFPDADRA